MASIAPQESSSRKPWRRDLGERNFFWGIAMEELLSSDGAMVTASVVEERLPFSVRLVQTEGDLNRAVSIRHSAYSRHVPSVASRLSTPETYDYDEDSVILLAQSKLDHEPIGTMRIQTNRRQRLPLEEAVELPAWLEGQSMAQASRLGISLGRVGRLVKTALFKAYWEYCLHARIDWMVIAARAPLDRQYEALLFVDLEPNGAFVPLRHAGNIPHRLMALEVATTKTRWHAAGHSLYNYMFKTLHPDIDPIDRRAAGTTGGIESSPPGMPVLRPIA